MNSQEDENGAVAAVLTDEEIDALKDAYIHTEGPLKQALRTVLPAEYKLSERYVNAVNDIFYGPVDKDKPPDPEVLSPSDRERCLIAMLASRGEQFTLGVHIYLGLMEGVRPEEIGNIILLAGIYSGVDNLTKGLDTEIETLKQLKQQLRAPRPRDPKDPATPLAGVKILGALKARLSTIAGTAAASGTSSSSKTG